MPTYFFAALFTKSKVGVAPTNAPTVDVVSAANDLVLSGGSPTALTNMTGVYVYSYTATAGNYIAMFKTADTTVDLQHVPSYTPQVITDNLDATVSSRNATTPPTASANATAVRAELATELARVDVAVSTIEAPTEAEIVAAILDALLAGHVIPGSVAVALSAAGAAGDPMTNQASGYASGTLGRLIQNLATYPVVVHRDTTDANGNLYLTAGCDYYAIDGRALGWTKATWPVLTGGTVELRVSTPNGTIALPCTVTAAQTVQLELSASQVDSLGLGVMAFDLLATLDNGHDVDLYLQQMLTVTSALAAP